MRGAAHSPGLPEGHPVISTRLDCEVLLQKEKKSLQNGAKGKRPVRLRVRLCCALRNAKLHRTLRGSPGCSHGSTTATPTKAKSAESGPGREDLGASSRAGKPQVSFPGADPGQKHRPTFMHGHRGPPASPGRCPLGRPAAGRRGHSRGRPPPPHTVPRLPAMVSP